MKEFYRQVSRFSIRKFSVGVASVLLGMSFVATASPEAVQAEEVTCSKITYHYVSEEELTQEEKALITTALPSDRVSGDTTYYMVYRPDTNGTLPNTGEGWSALEVGAGVTFLVCALTFLRKKKTWVATAFLVTSLGQAVLIPDASALTHNLFANLTQEFCLPNGAVLPGEVRDIEGYHFIGYIVEMDSEVDLGEIGQTPALNSEETVTQEAGNTTEAPKVHENVAVPNDLGITTEMEVSSDPMSGATESQNTGNLIVEPEVTETTEPVVSTNSETTAETKVPNTESPSNPTEAPTDSEVPSEPAPGVTETPDTESPAAEPTVPTAPEVESPTDSGTTPATEVPSEPAPGATETPDTANPTEAPVVPTVPEVEAPTDSEVPSEPTAGAAETPGTESPAAEPTVPTVPEEESPTDSGTTPDTNVSSEPAPGVTETPDTESPAAEPTVPTTPEVEEPPATEPTPDADDAAESETSEPEKHHDVLGGAVLTVTKPLAPLELMVAADKLEQGLQKEVDTNKKTPASVADYEEAKQNALQILEEANAKIVDSTASEEVIAEALQKVEEALRKLEEAEAALEDAPLEKPVLELQTLEKQEEVPSEPTPGAAETPGTANPTEEPTVPTVPEVETPTDSGSTPATEVPSEPTAGATETPGTANPTEEPTVPTVPEVETPPAAEPTPDTSVPSEPTAGAAETPATANPTEAPVVPTAPEVESPTDSGTTPATEVPSEPTAGATETPDTESPAAEPTVPTVPEEESPTDSGTTTDTNVSSEPTAGAAETPDTESPATEPTVPTTPEVETPTDSGSTPDTNVSSEPTAGATETPDTESPAAEPTVPTVPEEESPTDSGSTPDTNVSSEPTAGATETPGTANPTEEPTVPTTPEVEEPPAAEPTPDTEDAAESETPEPEKNHDVLGGAVLTVTKPLAPLELMVAADKLEQGLQKEVDTNKKTPASVADYEEAKQNALQILEEANAKIVDSTASEEVIAEALQKVEEALRKLEEAEAALEDAPLEKPVLELQTLEKQEKEKSVRVQYHLTDPDDTFISATAQIYAEDKLVKEVQLSKEDLAGFDISDLDYYVDYKIKTTFEYATLAENARETLSNVESFVLERKQIELKNLRDLSLYTYRNGLKTKVISLTEVGSIDDYFVSFISESGKEVQLPIKSITPEDNGFKVVATHPELVQRNANDEYEDDYSFMVSRLAPAKNDIYTSFKDLIEAINANPSGMFTLGADLSAGEIENSGESYVNVPFTGTLNGMHDGKNYTIYDLKATLFESTNSATLTNLNLSNVNVKSTKANVGALVNQATGTTIENVAIEGSITAPHNVAGLVYSAQSNTNIRNVDLNMKITTTATDTEMKSGGVVGQIGNGSIQKVHAKVEIDTRVKSAQDFGGVIGVAGNNVRVSDVYVEGALANKGGGRVGAVSGNAGRAVFNRIVSAIPVTNGSTLNGGGDNFNATEIYGVEGKSTANVLSKKITQISADAAAEIVESMGITATLSDKETPVGQSSKRIDYSKLPNYDATRETAYRNTEKLLPFYNREYIVKQGNKIDTSSKLFTTNLVSIVPMKDNEVIANLYKNKGTINRLLLNYADGKVEYLEITPGSTFADNTIQEYGINGTELLYTPEQFMTNPEEVIETAMNRVNGLTFFSEDVWKVTQNHPEIEADSPSLEPLAPYQREVLEILYLKDAFKKVHDRAQDVFEAALAQSVAGDFTTAPLKEQMKDYMKKNAVAILVGASYLNRLYNVQFDQMNVGELATFYQNFFGTQVNSLEWLANLGRMGNNALDIKNNPATYAKWIAPVSGYANLRDYLSAYRTRFTKLDENDWFKSATKAYIVEVQSKEVPDQKYKIYDQLNRIDHPRMILPLLNLTSEGIYIMSNMTTLSFGMYDRYMDMSLKETNPDRYASELDRVNKLVDYFAKTQGDHFDFWYRMARPEVRDRLYSRRDMPIPVWDGYYIPRYGRNPVHWMPKFGEGATSRMTDFFAPIGKYYLPNGVGAYATGDLVHYVIDKALTPYGQSVFTHEMTHNLDGTVYLGGYGRRESFGAEVFAQGLLQATTSATNQIFALNTNADFSVADGGRNVNNRVHNLSPDRFQTPADLKEYLQGRMDVIYTLEALAGNALVKLSKADQALFYKKIELINNIGESRIRQLSAEELEPLTLESVDNLVENDILLGIHGLHNNKEKISKNGYEVEHLFAANYSGLTNPNGSSDSLSIKRLSNELLAETGLDGFVAYLSNKYRAEARAAGEVFNDSYILKKITNNEFSHFHDFKKAMYKRRLSKVNQLKPVSFTYNQKTYTADSATLTQLIDEAIQADLEALKAKKATPNLLALNEEIFKAYLLDTKDFRSSIYQ
ncbi:YSIRK-type signal peptide-containing protein [Aerococcaceae bacterium zg-ZJ1578]|uniref:ZmpA/ZmpB/ZmpC family metallo-endopeptidase n=1 Tax=Aerococcaceae bacterium zg-252 TaxID=2796928 RepID=UPI001A2DA083|nr:YSIRK-type signal peptide-containing protein [Aerococcaceae bacterium zg-1578]